MYNTVTGKLFRFQKVNGSFSKEERMELLERKLWTALSNLGPFPHLGTHNQHKVPILHKEQRVGEDDTWTF